MKISFARSATKHRVPRAVSERIVREAAIRFRVEPGAGQSEPRILFLGADDGGNPIEVIAVEDGPIDLILIHAMPMRERYRHKYEEMQS